MSVQDLAAPAADPAPPPPPAPATGASTPSPDPPPGTAAPPGSGDDVPPGELVNVASDLHAGGDISISNYAIHLRESQRRTSVRSFSFADGRTVTEIEEQRAVEHFVGLEGEAEGLVRHLEERRVLVLSAAPGTRKVTAATGLALRLRERGACTEPPLVFDALDRHVRVDLRRMPEKHDRLRDRVVIFRYPLSRGNPYLADAFTTTDPAGWTQLADALRARNAFLVFTATASEADRLAGVHALQRMHRTLSPHPPEVMGRRLEACLAALRARGEAQAAETLEGFGAGLLERFQFGPQLGDFVEFYAGVGQPSMGLDEAHALFQDTSKRLLHDLDDDFDGWSFGFTLALAQCTPDANGVAWVDFDRLRRHLRRWLRRDLQLTPGGQDDEEQPEPSDVRLELSDDTLLTRSRARVEKDPATLADEIRFCDGRPPEGLWRDLLRRNRRVLTAILPRLRELAERPDLDGRSMSVLAAQIIGRIGEMDYERVVVPMAERWAALGGRHRGLVGPLFDGVLGSGDARYRARCLQYLQSMHAGGIAGPDKGRVEAATAAYSWVGYHAFGLAMGELFAIARGHLVPMIDDATRMSRLVTRIRTEMERAADKSDGDAVRAVQQVLRSLVDRIYAEHGGIFLGVQYALVSLCAAHGVAPVLRELRGWIGRGGASMGVLVALMFLHERGIANQLREERTEFPLGEGVPPAGCGQFVRALGNGDEDVLQAVRFLADLYDSVTSPWATEALVRRHFRDQLQAHLLEWAREGVRIPELAEPVRALFEQLARTHRGDLREMIGQMVATGDFARKPELRRFAASLRL